MVEDDSLRIAAITATSVVLYEMRRSHTWLPHIWWPPQIGSRIRIQKIARTRVRYGYRKIRDLVNREGWQVVKYLVERSY